MKKDFNNIEEVFKNAFDGFEANVDPSVWSNIQSHISAGNGLPNNPSSVAASASKAVLTKIVAGVVIASGLATSVYYLSDSKNEVKSPVSAVVTEIHQENNQEALTPTIEVTEKVVAETNTNETSVQNNSEKTTAESVEKQINADNNTKLDKQPVKTENKSQSNVVATPQNNNNTFAVSSNSNAANNVVDKKVAEQIDLTVKIKASQTKGKAPLDVEFNVDGNAVAYSWDFGDGSEISGQENSFHTYTIPGKYTVKLTAIDKNANAKTEIQVITVEQNIKSSISTIPTVFSPNADGINDIIKIDGENIKSFTAVVRDSKGNVVFEWKTLEGFWDGRDLNNQILPKGTYYIVVVAVGVDGENHTKKQTIQLF